MARDEGYSGFDGIGDFIRAVELDARKTSGKGRKGTRRKTKAQKLAESMKENPSARKKNAATQRSLSTQSSLFDEESVARARPVEKLQRVKDTETGNTGTVLAQDATWAKVKFDEGVIKHVRVFKLRAINPVMKKKAAKKGAAKRKPNGRIAKKIVGIVKRRRAVKRAGRAYERELKLEATLSAAKQKRLAAEKSAMARNPGSAFAKLVDRALVLLRKHNDLAHAKAQLEKAGERPQRAARAVAAAQSRLYMEATARNPASTKKATVKKPVVKKSANKRGKNPSIDAIAKLTGAVLNGLEIHKRLTGKPKRKQAATKAAWRSNQLDSDARVKGYAPVAPESVKNLFREFQGREPSGNAMQLYVPNGAPAHTSVIGALVEIGLESGKPIRFAKSDDAALKNPGAYLLQAERGDRRRLYAGLVKPFERMKNGAKIPRDYDYGLARHVVYWAQKPHLENDNKWRAYIHELGEDGGRQPKVNLYKNGRVGFLGGDYTIEARGIVN